MSFEQPITIDDHWFTGEDKRFMLRVYEEGTSLEDALADTGTRQDINGWTLTWALRKSRDGSSVILQKLGITIGDPANGEAYIDVSHADTTDLSPGEYFSSWARTEGGEQAILSFGEAVLQHGAIR